MSLKFSRILTKDRALIVLVGVEALMANGTSCFSVVMGVLNHVIRRGSLGLLEGPLEDVDVCIVF